jgi:hypothetical protein
VFVAVFTKLVALFALADIDLAAAHAGLATDLVVYGIVLMFAGFMMRWTTWDFGLGQVLWPDVYEEIGLWLLRLGIAMSFIGGLIVMAIEYVL